MQNELRQIHFHDPKKQKLFELKLSGTERMLDFIEEELKDTCLLEKNGCNCK